MNPRVPHFLAYTTPDGDIIPSTIRQKEGDARTALLKSDARHRHTLADCKLVNVTVGIMGEAVAVRSYKHELLAENKRLRKEIDRLEWIIRRGTEAFTYLYKKAKRRRDAWKDVAGELHDFGGKPTNFRDEPRHEAACTNYAKLLEREIR